MLTMASETSSVVHGDSSGILIGKSDMGYALVGCYTIYSYMSIFHEG